MKKIELPELPYDTAALEPYVSARTLEFHHGKHHHAYVTKLNDAIVGTDYVDLALEEIVRKASTAGYTDVFQNAAQAWNHTLEPQATHGRAALRCRASCPAGKPPCAARLA